MTEHWRWIRQRQRELERLAGQYVAVAGDEILAHAPGAGEVIDAARATGKPFWIFCVPTSWRRVRIYPIRVQTMRSSFWEPFYPVRLNPGLPEAMSVEMLVDSGADVSCISFDLGLRLGLVASPQEALEQAEGLGGVVAYLGRQIEVEIDGNRLTLHVAWIQSSDPVEPILGRAVFFDCFDVTIRQRDEEIELTWRGQAAG